VSNEEAAVLDETRERGPEGVVGEELEEAALFLEDELVEDPANNKVEDESKDNNQNNGKTKLF